MFPFKEFWPSAVFGGLIGGIISVLFIKLLEGASQSEARGPDLNGSQKCPQEHDEKFC